MTLHISDFFPMSETGLNSVGFLFGAGTSKEAGFPVMKELTNTVLEELTHNSRKALDEILSKQDITFNSTTGEPNIEVLSDLVTQFKIDTQDSRYNRLEEEIRKAIVKSITNEQEPDLNNHVCFLEALKRRAAGSSVIVTIITTNYDVLFELAASEVGVRIETGFEGPLLRQFDPAGFNLHRGEINSQRFVEKRELRVNLLKLHGSVSWFKLENRVIESGIDLFNLKKERSMVLPRRRKLFETLSSPFDQLFTRASQALGSTCKYLVSCGFSFSDQHINDHLIFPKLEESKIKLFALCGDEPECLNQMKSYPSFNAGFPRNCYVNGANTYSGTELWKFSELVKLFNS